jgi:uracil-DNA glycosylase
VPAETDSFQADLAALAWLIEMGADEAICDAPVDRFAEVGAAAPAAPAAPMPDAGPPVPPVEAAAGGVAGAAALAAACGDLPALRAALEGFEGCGLRHGARNLVFADGDPAARIMLVGEAPGREEDLAGLPFVGASGVLLDRMLASIGLARNAADPGRSAYITNVLPWRPPRNREPSADEVAMLLPFLFRHIELADPEILILLGSPACRAVLQTSAGVTRLRGTWNAWRGRPVMPMLHPAALLRDPELKRLAWADLLAVQARLEAG